MTYQLGRNRPVAKGPRLHLKNYLLRSLPAAPAACDYTKAVYAKRALSQMYLNDIEGDCVIAAMAHIQGVISGNAGVPAIYTPREINGLYKAIGGFNPNAPLVNGVNPTDNGCDIPTMLNYWAQYGAPRGTHKIIGSLTVNAGDIAEVRIAQWLFENLVFGVELPDAWISPFPSTSGFVWGSSGSSDPNNGHCVAGAGYDASGVTISTWGLLGTMTNAAVEEYASNPDGGELHSVLSPEMIIKAQKRAPNGFDWTQLLADFQALNG